MKDDSRFYTIPCLQRKPLCDVVEWAETRRYFKPTSRMYSYDPVPYFKEPCHYMSDLSGTSCVVIRTPSQTGKSESLLNFIGWSIEYRVGTILLVLDSQKQGIKMSSNRVRPFIRDVCGIFSNNGRNKNPDRSNSVANIGLKSGANLFIASAKSASDSKSTPARYVLLDETDAFPSSVNDEGDPITLFTQRTKRYRSSMVVMTSTPTTEEGNITANWRLGTAQIWGVICECGKWMEVKYDDIDFTGETPTIACPHCGQVYTEKEVIDLKHCYSDPSNPNPLKDGYGRIRRSYVITAPLCHSFVNWSSLKSQELAALALGEDSYRSFRNTVLGETYTPKDEVEIDTIELARRCQAIVDPDCLPQDVIGITIGVDTHDSCLYAFTAAFTADSKDIYGLSYKMLVGSPSKNEVWEALRELLNTQYTRIDGLKLYPSMLFIDSGGHHTNDVYRCTYSEPRMMPIKGFSTDKVNAQDPLIGQLKRVKMGGGIKASTKLLFLGVNAGKDFLQNRIILTMSGEQRLFYPKGRGFDVEYFKGLLSERKIEGKWRAKVHTHNEPLDCFVYALAAFQYWEMKFYRTGKDIEYMKAMQELKALQESANTENRENIENKENEYIKHVEEPVAPVPPKKKAPAW